MKTVFTLRRKLFAFFSNPVFSAVFLLLLLLGCSRASAQKYLVGDGFGGRKWYKPGNVTAGALSTGTINGQLYLWGARTFDFITPIPYTASPTYPISGAVDLSGLIPISVSAEATVATVNDYTNSSNGVTGITPAFVVAINPYAVPGFNNVKLVSVANGHNSALIKSDSTGWIWGESSQGYSGLYAAYWGSNATAAASAVNTPIKVINNAKFVSTGEQHIAFVKYDGTVWTLGDNEYGAYGNGTTAPNYGTNLNGTLLATVFMSTTPVQMTGITNAVRVAVFGHKVGAGTTIPTGTVILKADGTVWVSGCGGYLRSNSSPNVPTQVPNLSNIVDIKCSQFNAMALTSTGDVYVWGAGTVGPVYADGAASTDATTAFTFIPKKITFPPPAAPMVAIEESTNGLLANSAVFWAIDENHVLWKWGSNASNNGNYSAGYTPVIDAKHVVDVNFEGGFRYITRTNDYPVDERLWATGTPNGYSGYVNALNPDYLGVNAATNASSAGDYLSFVPGKYWVNTYNQSGEMGDIYYPCNPGAWGLSSMAVITATPTSTGNIDCSKTQLTPAPVAGTAAQSDLVVTVNVTALGAFTPTVTGSGFSLEDSSYTLTPTALGTQQFRIPVKYDGATALSTLMFTVSPATPAAGCTLTLNGIKPAIVNIVTTDCVPTVGPSLK